MQRAEIPDCALRGADCDQGRRTVPPQRALASARQSPPQRCAALRCNLQGALSLLWPSWNALPPGGRPHQLPRLLQNVACKLCMMPCRAAPIAAQLRRYRHWSLHVPRSSWAAFQGRIAFTPGTAPSRSTFSSRLMGLRQGSWNPWRHLLPSWGACRDALTSLESLSAVQVYVACLITP